VTNKGPSVSGPVAITDNLPKELLSATWTCSASVGSTCASAAGAGSPNLTANMDVNGSVTITITATVDPDAELETLTNVARATLGPDAIDPTPGPTEATDIDAVVSEADLSITKTHAGEVVAGAGISYTITVTNKGPSTARKVAITDTLPEGLLNATWTCTAAAGSTCPASGAGSIAAEVTVKPGIPVVFTLNATVSPDFIGELMNTASLTPGATTKDVSADDNSATDRVTPIRRGDVSVSKTDGRDYVIQGRYNTYGITVANSGPSTVRGVLVNDKMPRDFDNVEWTCEATGNATCSVVDLGPDSSVLFIVTGKVDKDAATAMTNTATISIPADFIDTNASNNTDKDTDRMWKEWETNPPKNNPKGSLTKAPVAPKTPVAPKEPAPNTPAPPKAPTVNLGDGVPTNSDVASSIETDGPILALTGAESRDTGEAALLLVLIGGLLLLLVRKRPDGPAPCVLLAVLVGASRGAWFFSR
jgi:uncharacterized repeat protein (TIGR01451 family)